MAETIEFMNTAEGLLQTHIKTKKELAKSCFDAAAKSLREHDEAMKRGQDAEKAAADFKAALKSIREDKERTNAENQIS